MTDLKTHATIAAEIAALQAEYDALPPDRVECLIRVFADNEIGARTFRIGEKMPFCALSFRIAHMVELRPGEQIVEGEAVERIMSTCEAYFLSRATPIIDDDFPERLHKSDSAMHTLRNSLHLFKRTHPSDSKESEG